MCIHDLFKHKTVFSLEVFPPRRQSSNGRIIKTLYDLNTVQPDFISVTLGAGGTTRSQQTTKIADIIQNTFHVPAVAHVPGLYQTKAQVINLIKQLQQSNVKNILALRGDKIKGLQSEGDFQHANQLVRFIHANFPKIDIAGACYPYPHPESQNYVDDIEHLKLKVDAGCTHLISQLFFDNQTFYNFEERTALAGIHVPIEAGIMPCTSKKQIERITEIAHVPIPEKYRHMMNQYADDPKAIKDAGIAYAIDQIIDLVSHGVDGIHLYTMDKADVTQRIWDATKNIFASKRNQHRHVLS
ncbi:methylenetetrahydrofolate reductase [Philodulcilactobacillus myokoensis]|uniref:Methylenetetrahydrofolate reductase n=1 Tax=Philodulcilactobacillus myokoensis TaxID=2929573 RepID=A0A9W6B3C2_9LACO|nr:methylenetetrahydrofolate reductase [NAD(P)H] [Philodulcilactobacillus myokoensis]GLB47443.1 methylenetetrahydrofolate reductase [Philodulcilactobacillus myokoensis]